MMYLTKPSLKPLIFLTVATAIVAGLCIVTLIAGAPNIALPTLQYASLKLSNTAVAAREKIPYTVTDPDRPVVLIYAASFCTAEYQAQDTYIYNTSSPLSGSPGTTTSGKVIDYKTMQCYNQSIGFSYNFVREFNLNETCVHRCAAKFRSNTARISRQYLAAAILALVLFVYEVVVLATTFTVNPHFLTVHLVISAAVTGLIVSALTFNSTTKPLQNGLLHCFADSSGVTVEGHGTGGVIVMLVGAVLSVVVAALSLWMMGKTDGRRTLPVNKYEQPVVYRGWRNRDGGYYVGGGGDTGGGYGGGDAGGGGGSGGDGGGGGGDAGGGC